MKKIFAILLLLCLSLGNIGNTSAEYSANIKEVYAANFLAQKEIIKSIGLDVVVKALSSNGYNEPISNEEYQEILSDILAGKVLNHYSHIEFIVKHYRLGDTITRQEVMKIIAKLSGEEISDNCEAKFSDVDQNGWGCKYIEWALKKGYIAANTTFRPGENITKTEAMKLIFKVRGVKKTQTTSNWQEDYMMSAYEYGIISEKYADYNVSSKRGWLFVIATATIEKEEEIKEVIKEKIKRMSDEASIK